MRQPVGWLPEKKRVSTSTACDAGPAPRAGRSPSRRPGPRAAGSPSRRPPHRAGRRCRHEGGLRRVDQPFLEAEGLVAGRDDAAAQRSRREIDPVHASVHARPAPAPATAASGCADCPVPARTRRPCWCTARARRGLGQRTAAATPSTAGTPSFAEIASVTPAIPAQPRQITSAPSSATARAASATMACTAPAGSASTSAVPSPQARTDAQCALSPASSQPVLDRRRSSGPAW